MRIALFAVAVVLATAPALPGQVADPQVQKYIKDGIDAFDGGKGAEFEFDLSANVLDHKDSSYASGKGFIVGTEKCYAKFTVTHGGETTSVEWYEAQGVAAVRIGGNPWQKASIVSSKDDAILFHWLSPVQLFKELTSTSTYLPDRSAQSPEENTVRIVTDLSPLMDTYMRRFGLDGGVNVPEMPPRLSAQLTFDTQTNLLGEVGYSLIFTQKLTSPPEKEGEDDWSWEDYEDRSGAADFADPKKPPKTPKAAEGNVNYGYQVKFVFTSPAKGKKPQAPKEVSALIPW